MTIKKDRLSKTYRISVRLSEFFRLAINQVCNNSPLTPSQISELALIDFLGKLDYNFIYEGIDLKNLLKLRKLKILRSMQTAERVEIKSRHLFVSRVKSALLIYIIKRRSDKDMIELINSYRKEAKFYTKTDELLKELDDLVKVLPDVKQRGKELLESEIDKLDFMRKVK